jgi:hypothetical protein
MKKFNFCFFGGGFLTSHIIPSVLPFAETITIIDRDRIEGGNYDNAIFPKKMAHTKKVTALGNLINILSDVPVRPIMKDIKNFQNIYDTVPEDVDFYVVTFDNLVSRRLVQQYARDNDIPALNVGVTENFGMLDWMDRFWLPYPTPDLERRMAEIADVCERIEFRTLGSLLGAYTAHVIYDFIVQNEKKGYILNVINGKIVCQTI